MSDIIDWNMWCYANGVVKSRNFAENCELLHRYTIIFGVIKMSVTDFQVVKSEKLSELGFMYYNKAVDGMEMKPEALALISDIRSRFGYLLYLKQNNGNEQQIAELDAQIAAQFVQLGEVCYGYYCQNAYMDADLQSICEFISTIDKQLQHDNEIANSLKTASEEFDLQADCIQSVQPQEVEMSQQQQPQPQLQSDSAPDISQPVADSDFVMPVPAVAAEQEHEEIKMESILIEKVEESLIKKCECGCENVYVANYCENCGKKFD